MTLLFHIIFIFFLSSYIGVSMTPLFHIIIIFFPLYHFIITYGSTLVRLFIAFLLFYYYTLEFISFPYFILFSFLSFILITHTGDHVAPLRYIYIYIYPFYIYISYILGYFYILPAVYHWIW